MARDPEDPIEIARRLGLSPELAKFMPRYIKIESGGDPNARTGSYVGLLQMGPDEIKRYGGKDLQHGAQMYADRAKWFQQQFGRAPDPTELYLINQQGEGGITNHMANPGAPAWQNMANTAEGRQKGEAWAKKAIWGNVPDDIKKQFPGGVDKLTSQQFMDIWRHKVERVPIPPRPPGDVPVGTQLASGAAPTPTKEQAFSLAPTSEQRATMLDAPAQKAISGATATPPPIQQYAERPSTANPLVTDAPGQGPFYRQRGSQGQGELAPQQVLANAPGMVPTPRERPGAAGPNAAALAAEQKAKGGAAGAYETKLSPAEETAFQAWKQKNAPNDSGADYDLRGAFKAGVTADPQTGHWPDTFKKPNHPTFSNQSQYATGENAAKAGHWEGDKFVPPKGAAQAGSAPAKTAPAGQTLGDKIAATTGASTYIDPNTGHQIINPSGSGEQAMGLTRDIGPASPARSAPAPSTAAQKPPAPAARGRTPTGPVPPAPEAAGRLAKPETMAPPEQTLRTLEGMRGKPNSLIDLYKSDTPPTNPPSPATFQEIAGTPPALSMMPRQSTLPDLPLSPYNVPLPPTRPGREDLGPAQIARADYGGPPQGYAGSLSAGADAGGVSLHVGPQTLSRLLDTLVPQRGFGSMTPPFATPAEAATRENAVQQEASRAPVLDPLSYDEAQRGPLNQPPRQSSLARLFGGPSDAPPQRPSQAPPTLAQAPRSADQFGQPSQPREFEASPTGNLGAALAGAVAGYSPGLLNQSQQMDQDILARRVAEMSDTARAAMTNPPPPQPQPQQWQQQQPVSPTPTQQYDPSTMPFSFQPTPLPILPDDLFAGINWGGGWGFSPG